MPTAGTLACPTRQNQPGYRSVAGLLLWGVLVLTSARAATAQTPPVPDPILPPAGAPEVGAVVANAGLATPTPATVAASSR